MALEVTVASPGKRTQTRITMSKEELEEWRRTIRAGGSSGDIFRDYVIAAYGRLDPAREAQLRNLNAKLAGHTGELFYARYLVRRVVGHSFAHGAEACTHPLFMCGFLTDDALAFSPAAKPCAVAKIPVAKHAREYLEPQKNQAYAYERGLRIHAGTIDADTLLAHLQPIFVVGEEAVRAWLKDTSYASDESFEKLLARLRA